MLQAPHTAAYVDSMSWRSWLGGGAVLTYVAVLAHVTGATTCPVHEGACEKVHALMRGRPSVARVVTIAEPMRSRTASVPLQLAFAER